MESHAEKYSQGYRAHKGYTFWEKDFDAMACKTMLRQIISKWGIMSIEMQKALENDMGVIQENGTVDYIDAPSEEVSTPAPAQQPEVVEAEPNEQPAPEEAPTEENMTFADILGA